MKTQSCPPSVNQVNLGGVALVGLTPSWDKKGYNNIKRYFKTYLNRYDIVYVRRKQNDKSKYP